MSPAAASRAYDVAVVGGGLSGLVAARELRHAGLHVVVVEARDRLGGRIWTRRVFDDDRDVGATFFHWTQPHIWSEIARYGLTLSQRPPLVGTAWFGDGDAIRGDAAAFHALIAGAMDAYCVDARTAFPQPYEPWPVTVDGLDRSSMAERVSALAAPDRVREAVHAFWSVNCNRDCSEAALSHALHLCALTGGDWRLFNEACARYKLAEGMSALVEAIARDGQPDVRLGAPVSRVEQTGDGVVVVAESGEFPASFAVVALPLNALRAVEFVPPLSDEKTAAIREGAPAGGFKLWLKVRGSTASSLFMAPPDRPVMFARYEGETSSGSVFSCYGADRAALGSDPLAAVQDSVVGWFPGARPDDCWLYDWIDDEFARETWRVPRPGQLSGFARALERPEGRVVLTGADYARGWCGFMDGAVESGLRVSRSLVCATTGAVR